MFCIYNWKLTSKFQTKTALIDRLGHTDVVGLGRVTQGDKPTPTHLPLIDAGIVILTPTIKLPFEGRVPIYVILSTASHREFQVMVSCKLRSF
jgi:hypothetical protein